MTTAETYSTVFAGIAILLSVAALIVSIVAIVRLSSENRTANQIRNEHLKLRKATVEIDIRNQINEARHNVAEFFNEHHDFLARTKNANGLSQEEQARRARLETASKEVIEGYLSALDASCQAYIDEKIDTVRFKKSYQRDIRQAVESEVHREFLGPGHAFHALMRVHDEWENPERRV